MHIFHASHVIHTECYLPAACRWSWTERTEQMDSLQSLVAEEYLKLRVVKFMEEKMGLNMADTLSM